ncbi:DUF192 domain-containing protein [Blattabacterium cuenoti]|uniref:DUF192 domain-containing protein n=1 Tax=Blattabacterium cuenoti TaxID=1653831 RepID=UPI00163B8E53|nr:DUF192 domain-containing protein [Blattabacterium cuenoti]
MKKNKFLLIFTIFLFLHSSHNRIEEEDHLFNIGDKLEIEFIKHGCLYIKNTSYLPIKKIEIELAKSPIEKKNGLRYRSSMRENRGMLFILENKEEIKKLDMKNMRIPLDIVYINNMNTVIFVHKYVSPMEDNIELVRSNDPTTTVKYVLEINAGMSEKWGIKEGLTKIFFKKI